jgi:protein involved in polysaccharide export with SLBB domain
MIAISSRGLALALVLFAAAMEPAAARQSSARTELRLRPGDALLVGVRDEPHLSGQFGVVDNGTVMLPHVGLVQVSGRTFGDVVAQLEAAYARELVEPEVQITPLFRIAVLGEVQRPGLFPVDLTYTVADVLATAGGVSPFGDPRRISLVRDGRVLIARLDPGSGTLQGRIQSGDHLIVGRRGWLQQHMPILVSAAASVAAAAVTSLILR